MLTEYSVFFGDLLHCLGSRRPSYQMTKSEVLNIWPALSIDFLLFNDSLKDLEDEMAGLLQLLLPLPFLQQLPRVGDYQAPVCGWSGWDIQGLRWSKTKYKKWRPGHDSWNAMAESTWSPLEDLVPCTCLPAETSPTCCQLSLSSSGSSHRAPWARWPEIWYGRYGSVFLKFILQGHDSILI